jgi:hypothetical protein
MRDFVILTSDKAKARLDGGENQEKQAYEAFKTLFKFEYGPNPEFRERKKEFDGKGTPIEKFGIIMCQTSKISRIGKPQTF